MPNPAVHSSAGELNLGHSHGFDLARIARFDPRHIDEWRLLSMAFLTQGDEFAVELLAEAGPDLAGVVQFAVATLAD